jgi:hypothetical protein
MQNFTITPTSPAKVVTATFVHADGSADTGYSAGITWSIDQVGATLLSLADKANNAAIPYNQIQFRPILPAANAGGVATITATSLNENGVAINSSFTVTISVNPNPATGFTFA